MNYACARFESSSALNTKYTTQIWMLQLNHGYDIHLQMLDF